MPCPAPHSTPPNRPAANQLTVSEYTYNGLGHRVGWHYDADTDADVDGSDPWYWFTYDERWRMVATYRGSDSNPKERFVYHNAGASGYGGSSYIDSVILRDTDDSVGWDSAAPDSTLQTRYYYLQNWRADVVALIEADGDPLEYVRYSPYGVPYVYGAGDVNRDGQVSILDNYAWDDYDQSGTGDMAVDDDVNRDGTVDSDDVQLITDQDGWGAWAGDGRGFVSGVSNRKGYAGYEFDPATTQWHVRHRVLVSEMGRWSRRDPLGYVDSCSIYSYGRDEPVRHRDPMGLLVFCPCGRCSFAFASSVTITNIRSSCGIDHNTIRRDVLTQVAQWADLWCTLFTFNMDCGWCTGRPRCVLTGSTTSTVTINAHYSFEFEMDPTLPRCRNSADVQYDRVFKISNGECSIEGFTPPRRDRPTPSPSPTDPG